MKRCIVALICVGVTGSHGRPATGHVIIDSNTTIDAANSFFDTVAVVEGLLPPTVVEIVEGGTIASVAGDGSAAGDGIRVFDSSIVNIVGGMISGTGDDGVNAWNSSTVNILGGVLTGGVDDGVEARNTSTVNISGGTISGRDDGVSAEDFSTVNVSGGFMFGSSSVYADSFSTVNISDGTFSGSVFSVLATGSSTVNISGGELLGNLIVGELSTVNIFGVGLDITGGLLTGTLADGNVLNHVVRTAENGRFILHEIPEPSTFVLAAVGLVGLLAWHRKQGQLSEFDPETERVMNVRRPVTKFKSRVTNRVRVDPASISTSKEKRTKYCQDQLPVRSAMCRSPARLCCWAA